MSNIMQHYEPELARLSSLYQKDKMHSALLISGAEASYLDVFCKSLACGMLNIKLEQDFCPDLQIIKYDETKAQRVIAVDNIRKINNFMLQTSYGGGAKIVIINSVNHLNKNSANALLKILEEPPRNSYFLLICHNRDNVLDTIKSRTITIELPRLNSVETAKILTREHEGCDAAEINNAAMLFSSGIENAKRYLIEGMDKIYHQIDGLSDDAHAFDIESLITKLDLKDEFTFALITKIIYHLCYLKIVPATKEQDLFALVSDEPKRITARPKISEFLDSFTTNLDDLKIYNLDKANFLRTYLTKFKSL